jgi:hypothetical protein
MQVITVASDLNNSGFVNYLKPSCEFYKMDFLVLEYDDVFFSNRLKDALLEEYLKQVDDDEIIFFTDATDTAFLTDEEEILKKYYSFNSPLVFSAEVNCWPSTSFESVYPKTTSPFKYLNSGGFIGKAGYIKKLYQDYPIFSTVYDEPYTWSNQHYWNHVFIKESETIRLDYNCDIFYNTAIKLDDINDFKRKLKSNEAKEMYDAEKRRLDDEIAFVGGRIESKIVQTLPCHIHFPGPIAKMLMDSAYFEAIKH